MRFMKDTEKDQLKSLVKACMLEISKLKMDLKKSREMNKDTENSQNLEHDLKSRDLKIQELENALKTKNESINKLENIINEKENYICELEEVKTYFQAVTAKPKRDLTSFQFQVYQLLPSEKGNTKKMHGLIKAIAFNELSYDNMFHILKNLERKGYFKSYKSGSDIIWEKIEKS
ncbi:hypothetical protein [Methanobacterium alcaliphilum]|uniref:hypothetical protein n=1 Tax=Methanobacterium alcaliphilum TaxID=392018 RepID=UPI00200AE378|nr:hypothetical protein [Methanobacterium alcaliphilum]MCK9150855.1 hypothetical protein [Methanobacterium alcaliphilum]